MFGEAPTMEMSRPVKGNHRVRELIADVKEVVLTAGAIVWLGVGTTFLVGAIRILTKVW
jgi:hypothetical protein